MYVLFVGVSWKQERNASMTHDKREIECVEFSCEYAYLMKNSAIEQN